MDKIKTKLKYIGFVIYIFCYLFSPPIIPNVNFIFIVFAYSVIAILIKYRKKLVQTFKLNNIKKLIKILIVYMTIYLLSIIFNGILSQKWYIDNYIINIYSLILAFPITITCSLYTIYRSEELKIDFWNLIKFFIYAGIIQAIIALLMLCFPTIKSFFINLMYYSTKDELLLDVWITSRRFYGFANSMLDLFGFGTGILALLPVYYGLNANKKFIILSPLLLIVPLLNSRSGLVIYAIGLFLFMITSFRKMKVKDIVKYVIVILIVLAVIIAIITIFSPNTIDWIIKDFKSFIFASENEEIGTADVLFSKEFWTIPPIENWLIGTGYSVSGYSNYAVEGITHSDVGYINEFWKTGIIGSCVLYYFIYTMLKMAYISDSTEKSKLVRHIFVFFGIAIIVFMIKGSVLSYNPGMAIIYTFALMKIIEKGEDNERESASDNSSTNV